ncbi:hypothetical protein DPEC_G00320620 [Dallia pectoralis]|uniref:Uncharacterized protein n=1 Tax=Dallia pectoralis TaxID=75939 RepID=A0ACC2F9X5_DALPE|nr:hypothetical protein DPEC_G00320620 [Dallia pectoralis]
MSLGRLRNSMESDPRLWQLWPQRQRWIHMTLRVKSCRPSGHRNRRRTVRVTEGAQHRPSAHEPQERGRYRRAVEHPRNVMRTALRGRIVRWHVFPFCKRNDPRQHASTLTQSHNRQACFSILA